MNSRRKTFLSSLVGALLPQVLTWSSHMTGGLKLKIGDRFLSVTTDVCPGGIFFKKPVQISAICTHGYFFRRPNGCKMSNSDIIGGANYACERTSDSVQALIPLTNHNYPLDHTIVLYDDPDSLRNMRRFTYFQGLEEAYRGNSVGAMGMTVVNSGPTPPISIGDMCYEGRKGRGGSAYVASVGIKDSKNRFVQGCSPGLQSFPWMKSQRYTMTVGNSSPGQFKNETQAILRDSFAQHEKRTTLGKLEIWDGLAFCLQDQTYETREGRIKVRGLYPSLERLKPLCKRPQPGRNNNIKRLSKSG